MNLPEIVWTPRSLLDWTEGFFQEKGIPSPRLDAELLLAHVLSCQRIDLYLQYLQPLEAGELARFRALVRGRASRRPLAYLTGESGFWNLTLKVNEATLVPSPDTEILVEGILEAIASLRSAMAPDQPVVILELGTGSGAIPLAVCSEVKNMRWVAVELSADALAVAQENKQGHTDLLAPRDNILHLIRGDRFAAIPPRTEPHLVVGNPPYIPTEVIKDLMPEVATHFPRMALDGGTDGLSFHRYLLDYGEQALRVGGRILMEMGAEQAEDLSAEVSSRRGLRMVEIRKDLAGLPRVVHVERGE